MAVETITDGGVLYGLLAVGAGLATGLAGIGAGVVSRVSELLWWASWLRSPASWARVSS